MHWGKNVFNEDKYYVNKYNSYLILNVRDSKRRHSSNIPAMHQTAPSQRPSAAFPRTFSAAVQPAPHKLLFDSPPKRLSPQRHSYGNEQQTGRR